MLLPWAFGFYLVGLGAAMNYDVAPGQMAVLILIGIAMSIYLRKFRIASIILVLCCLPLGGIFGRIVAEKKAADILPGIYLEYDSATPLRIYGRVVEDGLTPHGSNAVILSTDVIESRGKFNNLNTRLLVFYTKTEIDIFAGNRITFDCTLGERERYLDSMQVKNLFVDAWCFAQRGSMQHYDAPGADVSLFLKFKASLVGNLTEGLQADYASLNQGVVFGRSAGDMSAGLEKKFYDAGISHLIVASGAQVALMIFPFLTMYDRMRNRWARAILFIFMAIAMIVLYFIVGHESSILRAISVGYVLLIGRAIGRPGHALNSIAFAGMLWLIISPDLLNDAGFLLSYSSAFGILYLAPVLVAWVERRYPKTLRGALIREPFPWNAYYWVKRNLIHLMVITVTSQWGVMPIIALKFGRISFNGILANLFAVPAGTVVLLLGAVSGVLGFIHPALSLVLNIIALPFLHVMINTAEFFSGLGVLTINHVRPPLLMVVAYYVVTITAIEMLKHGTGVLSLASRVKKGDLDLMDE